MTFGAGAKLLAAIALMECVDLALARQLEGAKLAKEMMSAIDTSALKSVKASNIVTIGKIEGANSRKLMQELERELQCDATASCDASDADCETGADCAECCGTEDCECEGCGDCETDAAPDMSCTVQMPPCTGGPDPDCATYFTSMMYYNAMANQCAAQTVLYPDGTVCEGLSIEGCPVDDIMGLCEMCPWMGTQNTCSDAKLPDCLMAALPALKDYTGGFAPHTAKGYKRMVAYQERKAAREAKAAAKKAAREAAALARKK